MGWGVGGFSKLTVLSTTLNPPCVLEKVIYTFMIQAQALMDIVTSEKIVY